VEIGIPIENPMPDLLPFVERGAGVPVAILELGQGLAGAYFKGGLIFVTGNEALVRQRFTLAHELGHHRLGHESVVDPTLGTEASAGDPREVEANFFAAELLAPRAATLAWAERELDGEPTLEDVVRFACDFRISAMAARIRLERAGVLRDRKRIDRLDGEIARSQHTELARLLGLAPAPDSLEAENEHLPRIPEGHTALSRYLRGECSLGAPAHAIGKDLGPVDQAVRALGLLPRASA
jgi:Zn-dependent peptidase ImmA (M78 family)